MPNQTINSLYDCELVIEDIITFLNKYTKYDMTKLIQGRLWSLLHGDTNSLEDLMFLVEADGLAELVNNPDMGDYLLAQKYGYQL